MSQSNAENSEGFIPESNDQENKENKEERNNDEEQKNNEEEFVQDNQENKVEDNTKTKDNDNNHPIELDSNNPVKNENDNNENENKNENKNENEINYLKQRIEELNKENIRWTEETKAYPTINVNDDPTSVNATLQQQLNEANSKIIALEEENTNLTSKLSSLKQSVIQLKDRLEKDIYNKLDSKTKILKETLQINEKLQKKIESYESEGWKLKSVEEQLAIYRDKFNSMIKDKIDIENYVTQQEQTITTWESEVKILNEENQEKDAKYRQWDKTYLSIIRVIEQLKKNIRDWQEKLMKKQEEEKKTKWVIYEKDQEIALLRSFITSLKNENSMRYSQNDSIVRQYRKGNNNQGMKNNMSNQNLNNSNNVVLPTINHSGYGNNPGMIYANNQPARKEESFRIENSNSNKHFITVNDPEEENWKEITGLMKKILDE